MLSEFLHHADYIYSCIIKRDGFDINLPQIKQYTEEEMYRSVYRYSPVHILKDCIKHNKK